MSIKIIKAGVLTTLQDAGRYGNRNIGIGSGGAMDNIAMKLANFLVGNKDDVTVLEMHFPAPEILFEQDAIISLTGADFKATINEIELPVWHTVFIKKDTVLKFIHPISGTRSYMAVYGGFQAQKWLDSYSTHLKLAMGGYCGRAMQKDDSIHFQAKNFLFAKNKISKIRTGRTRNCEVEIFTRRNNTYPDFCKTTIFKLEEPKIVELKDKNSILIICPQNETAELDCEDEIPKYVNLWNTSVLHVNKSCNVHIGNIEVNFREKKIVTEPVRYKQIEFNTALFERFNFKEIKVEKLPTIVKPMDFVNIGKNLDLMNQEMNIIDALEKESIVKHPNIIIINVIVLIGVLVLIVKLGIYIRKKRNPIKRVRKISTRLGKKNRKIKKLKRKLRKSLDDVEEDIELGELDGNEDVPN